VITIVGLGKFTIPKYCKLKTYSNGRFTFSPFWKCTHGCLGCYAKKGYRWNYWSKRSDSKVSVDFKQCEKDYMNLKPNSEIEISPSCDPFDLYFEKKYRATRRFLTEIVPLREDIFLTFLSKSRIISEYIDLYPRDRSIFQISVESYKDKLKITSPNASNYNERLNAIRRLVDFGFKCSIRIDPIIPKFDTIQDIENIIEDFLAEGIKHITCSTIKVSSPQDLLDLGVDLKDSLKRREKGREFLFRKKLRQKYAQFISNKCDEYGITFAMCRENLADDTGFCDPFHLLKDYSPNKASDTLKYKKLSSF
jgi:DNA repair photolyase